MTYILETKRDIKQIITVKIKPKGEPKIYKQMYTKPQNTPSPSINLQLKPLLYVPKYFLRNVIFSNRLYFVFKVKRISNNGNLKHMAIERANKP